MYYVYVLQSLKKSESFYTGYTSDLKIRFKQHNDGKNTSTAWSQWRLVYYEAYASEDAARDRERILKHNGRVKQFLMKRIKKHLE